MQHVRRTIEELRRYIAASKSRSDLEEVDVLLAVALEEVRRKLAAAEREGQSREGDQR
jgi:predicted transcriptional regulator